MSNRPLVRIFKINRGGRERRRKEKGAGVGAEKRPVRRGVAWGLSQRPNLGVENPPKVAARQCGNGQIGGHLARLDHVCRDTQVCRNPQGYI